MALSRRPHVHEHADEADSPRAHLQQRARTGALVVMALVAAALPLVGLVSLLLRSQLDPHIENYPLHFVVFGVVGAVAFGLGYAAGEAANRRGDARVLLLSLAFMATGGFLWLHALGTPSILFSEEHAGFQVAIPGRAPGERDLCGGLGVRRRPSRNRGRAHSPADAPSTGRAGRHGRVVRLDRCESSAAGRAGTVKPPRIAFSP